MQRVVIAVVASMLGAFAVACDGNEVEATPGYTEVFREPGLEGDVAYILVPPGEHDAEALEVLVRQLIAEDSGVWGLEVFDNEEAVEAGLSRLLSAADLALLNEHHLISVIGRQSIRFQGPYSELGEHPLDG